MKRTSYLINAARGPLVREADLADSLRRGVIAGAAVDVLSREPMTGTNPLLGAPNLVVTPHIAWATLESRRRLMAAAAANIRAFLSGSPINVVNPA
jgi:glycerate dehydrogenase